MRHFCAEESIQAAQAEPISANFLSPPLIGWKRIVDDSAAILIAIESVTEDVAEFSSSTGGQPCLLHRATLFEGPLRGRSLGSRTNSRIPPRERQPVSKNWRVFCCAAASHALRRLRAFHPNCLAAPAGSHIMRACPPDRFMNRMPRSSCRNLACGQCFWGWRCWEYCSR